MVLQRLSTQQQLPSQPRAGPQHPKHQKPRRSVQAAPGSPARPLPSCSQNKGAQDAVPSSAPTPPPEAPSQQQRAWRLGVGSPQQSGSCPARVSSKKGQAGLPARPGWQGPVQAHPLPGGPRNLPTPPPPTPGALRSISPKGGFHTGGCPAGRALRWGQRAWTLVGALGPIPRRLRGPTWERQATARPRSGLSAAGRPGRLETAPPATPGRSVRPGRPHRASHAGGPGPDGKLRPDRTGRSPEPRPPPRGQGPARYPLPLRGDEGPGGRRRHRLTVEGAAMAGPRAPQARRSPRRQRRPWLPRRRVQFPRPQPPPIATPDASPCPAHRG